MSHVIRLTIRPGDEITVSDAEYERLLDMGLIYDGTPPDPVADPFDARVAERLGDTGSATRAAIEALVSGAAGAVQDPFVAGLIADDDSATAVALKAVVGGAPAHAGLRKNRYDAERSVYNLKASNTRRVRAALGAARAGTGLARLTFAGDSLTAGFGSVRGTSDPATFLRRELERLGYPVGDLIHTVSGQTEPRLIRSGSWSDGSTSLDLLAGSQGATLTLTDTGTALDIVAADVGATWSYSIDGAGPTFVVAGGTSVPKVVTTDGLGPGEHTVVITQNDPGQAYFHSVGFRPAAGVVVESTGIGGSNTTDWTTLGDWTPGSLLNHAGNVRPDLIVIELGINDWVSNLAVDTYRTNLTTLTQRCQATNATVMLTASQGAETNRTDWSTYVAAIYDVADARDVPLLDLYDRLGAYGDYNADGTSRDLAVDSIHLTPAGYASKGRGWLDLLAA